MEKYIYDAMKELHNEKVNTLKRFERQAFRYVDALKHGATGKLADFLVKTYKSHRGLPPGW